jgi:tetratricopeptide (TPR) repeat protein
LAACLVLLSPPVRSCPTGSVSKGLDANGEEICVGKTGYVGDGVVDPNAGELPKDEHTHVIEHKADPVTTDVPGAHSETTGNKGGGSHLGNQALTGGASMVGMDMSGTNRQPDGSGKNTTLGTADTVPTSTVISEIEAAAAKAKSNRIFGSVIESSARGVIEDLRKNHPDSVPATNVGAFNAMLQIQLDENRAMWQLGRDPNLTPEQRRAAEQKIHDDANARMGAEVHGMEVMGSFHTEFKEAWEAWKAQRQDRDEWRSGLPSNTHIGDMLRKNPTSPSNWTLDGQSKLESGDTAGGRASLDKAIANGGTSDAFALRGSLRLNDKDYDGAYQDAKKALELNPGDKNAMFVLKSAEGRTSPGLAGGGGSGGAAYENRPAGFAAGGFDPGRPREIPGMTAAGTLSSNQKLDEARRAMGLGDMQQAIALAQRALELNANNAAAHNFLSIAYARMRDYPRAIAAASAGLALAPRDAALLNNKAFAQNRSKRYRDALESSNHAIEADARNPYSFANRAYAYGGLGDKQSMMSDINQAAALNPAFQKAAADAAALQLPSNADILFLFPGEETAAPAAAPPARSRSFGLVVGAGILGGLLLALGLLSTVLAPLKDSVVSAFTKATRRGPSVHALEEEATPAAAPAAASGVIRGQYEILRQIGAGGMGMVYEGTDRSLGRRVAIKKMRDELRVNARERDRFVIEAKTVASLHHPNIVDIYAIAEEGDDVYLVFEYVDGKTVHDLVQSQGRLSPADSARVTRAMGEALAYAHSRGVIHRDMKPSNVMLTAAGQVKVMDFGIARMAKDALTRYSMTNTVVGTPPYMAPEQEQGVVRKESDVYSLAICSYEMLTGKLPFIGVAAGMLMNKINMSYIPPSRAIAGLPDSLDEVFLKAFQADPDQRYRTPQEFSAALEAALGGVNPSIKPV